ncbi:MAG: glycosyltransferase family 2 protein [bacterium]|nr:glycosyltransferase family 2 protein [bacterium]
MHLSWIIPTYNEEKRIEKTLREVEAYLKTKNFSYEILIADSASKDKTREIINKITAEFGNVRLIEIENRGKGNAVKVGMLAAQGDIRLFSDADNSTVPNYFDQMIPFFEKGHDIVISSRDPKDAKGAARDVKEPWYREILGRLGNLIIQIFGVWGIWDTQNGFKAFTKKAAEAIFSMQLIPGFAFDIEILALAKRLGFKMAIIPVRWHFEADSKVTLKAYLNVFLDVFHIRWNFISGKYKFKK